MSWVATRTRLVAMVLSAGLVPELTGGALAGNMTLMRIEVSTDGRIWRDAVRVDAAHPRVLMRASVTFLSPEAVVPLGFASLTWQPTISNWANGADQVVPFADSGTNTSGGSVPDVQGPNGPFGRIVPFASTGPTSSDAYRGHVNLISGTQYLRFARAGITNWVGEGPTSGTGAFNNFNGSGGIESSQRAWSNVSSRDPRFSPEVTECVLLKLGFDIDARAGGRTMVIDAPPEGMSRNAATGEREASWFASESDTFGQIKGRVEVRPARILVIPEPGVGAAVCLVACFIRRRRGPTT